ncbi:adenylate/guanylate cyclase domain-containing protein [Nocardioides piscis]|uniref:Adenylate/guanylate cyclase domain-containing protein n=1 Tax=Nocardioides piscis TaxID=2714938 RepID=A0A6G7YD56_9ACTN|nr:adenylate/guanylate cyclase domain-containing protein [Nocardioides piscis]QIK74834.1 adenylate/guanylate cyclase domain-containing protein [Nocardioides piscis]
MSESDSIDLGDSYEEVESFLLGGPPTLTRLEVAERAGVPMELATELWRLLGFVQVTDETVAFTASDVQALRLAVDLMELDILSPDSQAALVRTWGRSFARLAEWQATLLTDLAIEAKDPGVGLAEIATEVVPRVEALQSYVWRRHLASTANRLLATASAGEPEQTMAVCFVDIVGYTTQSKSLEEAELVEWIERFEQAATTAVIDRGGRVIKTIGDEILFTTDEASTAAEIALALTARGRDSDDLFPDVRAGIAYGAVVNRLGDVFGATVNIASRLTSVARPGTVVVDRGAHAVLTGEDAPDADEAPSDEAATADGDTGPEDSRESTATPDAGPEADNQDQDDSPSYQFRRIRRVSVKGYSRLEAWRLRPTKD